MSSVKITRKNDSDNKIVFKLDFFNMYGINVKM